MIAATVRHSAAWAVLFCLVTGGPLTGASTAAEPASPGRPPTFFGLEGVGERIVYVCDRSGSMSEPEGRPLAAARRELLASIESLGASRQFHVILYNQKPTVFEPPGGRGRPVFADADNLRAVRRFVEGTPAAGGTRHYEALAAALRLSPDTIFLLTDADAADDLAEDELGWLTGRLGRTRCLVVQFGGGEGRRSPRLARLAEASGGEYRIVEAAGD